MDERIEEVIYTKINEAISKEGLEEIYQILETLPFIKDKGELALGIIIGRVYNSFHYQSRRILKRDVSNEEFKEFISLLSNNIESIKYAISKIKI